MYILLQNSCKLQTEASGHTKLQLTKTMIKITTLYNY